VLKPLKPVLAIATLVFGASIFGAIANGNNPMNSLVATLFCLASLIAINLRSAN
jgi:hypothetical protein